MTCTADLPVEVAATDSNESTCAINHLNMIHKSTPMGSGRMRELRAIVARLDAPCLSIPHMQQLVTVIGNNQCVLATHLRSEANSNPCWIHRTQIR